jgi:uncharacterized protein YggE
LDPRESLPDLWSENRACKFFMSFSLQKGRELTMPQKQAIAIIALLACCGAAYAQQPGEVQLSINPANRTLSVSAEGRVTVDPDVAILHVGFETQPSDAKTAYSDGAKTSNDIVTAIKQAGIAETAIHSEYQRLNSVYGKPHKFTLAEEWTVKVSPERAAEILDIAVSAGATDSGQIDWTVADEQALADKALNQASARARSDAALLANGMGVHLGALIYVTNQIPAPQLVRMAFASKAVSGGVMAAPQAPPLAIEPRKVDQEATVYAVFAIE